MSFSKCFDEIIAKRVAEINDEIAKAKWYVELQDKLIEIQKRKCNPDLYEYASVSNEILEKTLIEIYTQAFYDVAEFHEKKHSKWNLRWNLKWNLR